MRAKEIMTRDVIAVTTATTLKELARIVSIHRINGVPVLDEKGNLEGVITQTDLLRILRHICFWDEMGEERSPMLSVKESLTREKDKAVVGTKMTKLVHTVKEDDEVDHVLRLMCRYDIHTIPVVNANGKLVGIIGATDIVNHCI